MDRTRSIGMISSDVRSSTTLRGVWKTRKLSRAKDMKTEHGLSGTKHDPASSQSPGTVHSMPSLCPSVNYVNMRISGVACSRPSPTLDVRSESNQI